MAKLKSKELSSFLFRDLLFHIACLSCDEFDFGSECSVFICKAIKAIESMDHVLITGNSDRYNSSALL